MSIIDMLPEDAIAFRYKNSHNKIFFPKLDCSRYNIARGLVQDLRLTTYLR